MDSRGLLLAPLLATAIGLVPGVWLGYVTQGKRVAAAIAAVPLVLPPTLICAYFFLTSFTLPVAVLAGSLFGLPFLLRTSRQAFQAVNRDYLNAARSLGGSEWQIFWRIALPLTWRPILVSTGVVFARLAAELAVIFAIVV